MSETKTAGDSESPATEASQSRIQFDLMEILSPTEFEAFKRSAEEAKAASLTDHFLNLTLRLDTPKEAA